MSRLCLPPGLALSENDKKRNFLEIRTFLGKKSVATPEKRIASLIRFAAWYKAEYFMTDVFPIQPADTEEYMSFLMRTDAKPFSLSNRA